MNDRSRILSDTELVSLSQGGDSHAFDQLTERCTGSLFRFTRRLVGNEEDARDICQEAMVKAHLNIRRLRDPDKFMGWLYHITLNLARDRFRSPRTRLQSASWEEDAVRARADEERAGRERTPLRDAHEADLVETVEAVLAKLPEEQRTAILLREYQGFTSEEVGEITGVPSATVRTRIFYGLKTVRRRLREQGISGSGL
jgi:RNA polymerase sigma-70 factor (ECF subfamily)